MKNIFQYFNLLIFVMTVCVSSCHRKQEETVTPTPAPDPCINAIKPTATFKVYEGFGSLNEDKGIITPTLGWLPYDTDTTANSSVFLVADYPNAVSYTWTLISSVFGRMTYAEPNVGKRGLYFSTPGNDPYGTTYQIKLVVKYGTNTCFPNAARMDSTTKSLAYEKDTTSKIMGKWVGFFSDNKTKKDTVNFYPEWYASQMYIYSKGILEECTSDVNFITGYKKFIYTIKHSVCSNTDAFQNLIIQNGATSNDIIIEYDYQKTGQSGFAHRTFNGKRL